MRLARGWAGGGERAHGEDIPRSSSEGLSTAEKDRLPTADFAFPEQRKEPLVDAAHVRNAISRFDQVEGVTDDERDQRWSAGSRVRSAEDLDLGGLGAVLDVVGGVAELDVLVLGAGFVVDIVMLCTMSGALALVTFSRRSAPPFCASSNCAPASCTVAVAHVPVPGLVTVGPF